MAPGHIYFLSGALILRGVKLSLADLNGVDKIMDILAVSTKTEH